MISPRGYILKIVFVFFLAGFPAFAYADTLDDKSIKDFYDRSTAVMRDPSKIQAFAQEKMDNAYTLQQNTTVLIRGYPAQDSTVTVSKDQVVSNANPNSNAMKIETIANTIIEIKYSDDHQFAFVTHSLASTGTIGMITAQPNSHTINVHFENGQACVDKLELVHDELKYIQSSCNDKLVLRP